MEKRTILAIALSFLVLMGFDFVYRNYMAPEQPLQIEDIASEESIRPEPERLTEQLPERLEDFSEITSGGDKTLSETDTKADGPNEIIIQGELFQAVLDNRGAVLASWILNDYKSSQSPSFMNWLRNDNQSSQENAFEMIATSDKGEKWPNPGALYFEDERITELANEELYEVTINGEPYFGLPLKAPVDVVMTLRRGSLEIVKTYSFNDDNYTFDFNTTFIEDGKELEGQVMLGQDIGPIEEHIKARGNELAVAYYNGEKVKRESAPDTDEGNIVISGNICWVGLDMHYFTAIAIPERPIASFDIKGYEIKTTDLQSNTVELNLLSLKIPVDGSFNGQVYLGPKKQSNLKAIPQYDVSEVIDYGMFSIIAKPLLSALRWIHQYVNNYGFAIILLTMFLSILLFPLRLKQMLSMKKMQAVQPKVKAIQEKYKKYKKTDPKRAEMNQEIMGLYKANNVNPLGGCLPLLVQMPLLFAFYRLLAVSIELRQAPFIFWIQDLAAKDPAYVLPIVMGITMFLSQKMTPMAPTADSSQMKMMQYLPVIFTFMFLTVSSGLNLYFLCSNIFQVGFQKIAERWMGDGKNDRKSKRKQ